MERILNVKVEIISDFIKWWRDYLIFFLFVNIEIIFISII